MCTAYKYCGHVPDHSKRSLDLGVSQHIPRGSMNRSNWGSRVHPAVCAQLCDLNRGNRGSCVHPALCVQLCDLNRGSWGSHVHSAVYTAV